MPHLSRFSKGGYVSLTSENSAVTLTRCLQHQHTSVTERKVGQRPKQNLTSSRAQRGIWRASTVTSMIYPVGEKVVQPPRIGVTMRIALIVWLLCISLTGAAQSSSAVQRAQARTTSCKVFWNPARFVGDLVTIEATVKDAGPHSPQILTAVACAPSGESFFLSSQDENLRSTKADLDYVRFQNEPLPVPEGVLCSDCLRYQITRILATGRLTRIESSDRPIVEIQESQNVLYSFQITRVLDVEAVELKFKTDEEDPAVVPFFSPDWRNSQPRIEVTQECFAPPKK